MLAAVIMAGGQGQRFWPYSRAACPKQFLQLVGEETMLQATVNRVAPLTGMENIYVVTGTEHAHLVKEQLPALAASNLLVEPEGKNTAPCIGLAAVHLQVAAKSQSPVMLVLPADHLIADVPLFRSVLAAAAQAAQATGSLVTLGIRPERPETGYGYIHMGEAAGEFLGHQMHVVNRFVEKPDPPTAEEMLASGDYLWNSGMFVWRVDVIRRMIQTHLPQVHAGLEEIQAALQQSDEQKAHQTVIRSYAAFPNISIDYGIMEQARDILVLPCDLGWDDVGSWPAVARYLTPDPHGNVSHGKVATLDTENCILYNASNDRILAVAGVEGLVIVETDDAVLVCAKDQAQQVRKLVEVLQAQGLQEYL